VTAAAPSWGAWTESACALIDAEGRWRVPRVFDTAGTPGNAGLLGPVGDRASGPGVPTVAFASNDYLGLTAHPAVRAAAHAAIDRWGTGSGASRLVTGTRPVHAALEEALADWKACERAVVLPTGFAANLAVLSVFGSSDAHLYSDALNHASIVDGCRAAAASVTVYPHRHPEAVEHLMASAPHRPVVVSDTVFSMDGDEADLPRLVGLACRWGALLVLDEAHAVCGPELTRAEIEAVEAAGGAVLRVGTLSKTLGSVGGFVAGPARCIELLENRARPYIFTTAPTPADMAAALAALGVLRSGEGDELLRRLAVHVALIAGLAGTPGHRAPIVPFVLGAEDAALAASQALLDAGLWVPAIRPPTVPPGTSRLRVTLSAAHSPADVDRLVAGLAALGLVSVDRPGRVGATGATGATGAETGIAGGAPGGGDPGGVMSGPGNGDGRAT